MVAIRVVLDRLYKAGKVGKAGKIEISRGSGIGRVGDRFKRKKGAG